MTCSIAFKEWAVVCEALARGEQTIILRKGGIHEGHAGFRVAHREFWLLPTTFHASADALTERGQALLPDAAAMHADGVFRVGQFAVVEEVREVLLEEDALALEGLHIWSPGTVLERFAYKRPGLYCLVVRVYRRAEPFEIRDTPAIAGCRSWVELPEPIATAGLMPVMSEEAFAREAEEVRRMIRSP